MKVAIGLFMVFVSTFAFAGSRIDLSPGSSVTVNAGDTTVVTCSGSSHSRGTHFCRCKSNGDLIRVDVINGQQIETEVSSYSNRSDCDRAVPSHPSCQ